MEPTNTSMPQPSTYDGRSQRGFKIFLLVLAVLLIAGGIVTGVMLTKNTAVDQESEGTAPAAQIVIDGSGLTPSTIQIKKGQSVVWINADQTPHTINANAEGEAADEGFGSPEQLDEGETYEYVFNQAGTYSYADATNPQRLQGVIIVK